MDTIMQVGGYSNLSNLIHINEKHNFHITESSNTTTTTTSISMSTSTQLTKTLNHYSILSEMNQRNNYHKLKLQEQYQSNQNISDHHHHHHNNKKDKRTRYTEDNIHDPSSMINNIDNSSNNSTYENDDLIVKDDDMDEDDVDDDVVDDDNNNNDGNEDSIDIEHSIKNFNNNNNQNIHLLNTPKLITHMYRNTSRKKISHLDINNEQLYQGTPTTTTTLTTTTTTPTITDQYSSSHDIKRITTYPTSSK